MVLSIVNEIEDWEKLKADLIEINYPYSFDDNITSKDKKNKWKFW